jgi:hypothetical protein
MTTTLFWLAFTILLVSVLNGMHTMFAAYDHVGHSPLALDVRCTEGDFDEIVRDAH